MTDDPRIAIRDALNDPDLLSDILAEIIENAPSEFALDEYCSRGGWPSDISVELSDIDDDPELGTIYATCSVSFTEVVPSSCGDISGHHLRFAKGTIEIDRSTGRFSLDLSHWREEGDR